MLTEQDMVEAVAIFLRKEDYRVAIGVPFMSQCIDLVYENHNKELIAIEFKKHDWKRAIRQSTTHRLGAEWVSICLLRRKVSDDLRFTLLDKGIGLLLYDPLIPISYIDVLPPKRNEFSIAFPRKWLRDAFERHADVGSCCYV